MSLTISNEIADLVRELRQQLGLSQERFATKLGVSFRTVNRWENRRAVPSALALKQLEGLLYELSQLPEPAIRECSCKLLKQHFQS